MSRRGNREGSIYKRADGRWCAAVSLPNGQRKAFYGRRREDVARKLAQALKQREDGLPLVAERQTVAQFLGSWLEGVARPTVRATTFEGYERIVRLHVNPNIGSVRLARLTPQALAGLYCRLLDKGLSAKTVRLVHAMLHRALGQAVRWGSVALNVADAVDAPRPQRREFRTLTAEEAGRLLDAAREDRFHALYVVALTCGLREGELLGLRWADIDFEKAALGVRQQAIRVKGQWLFSEPKTAKGRRTVTLPSLAVEALRQHRAKQAPERLHLGPAWEDNDLVFPNQVGRPMERQNLTRRLFGPALQRAGLPHIRFHDLRHSAATLLLSQGVHPKVVQERLGHSTIAVTMDIYSHVMPSLQREAAQHLDRLFAAL